MNLMTLRVLCTRAAIVAGVLAFQGTVWANILEDTNTTGAIATTTTESTATDAAAAAATAITAATTTDTRTEAEKLLDAYKNGDLSCESSTALECTTTTTKGTQTCVEYKTRTSTADAWGTVNKGCTDTNTASNDENSDENGSSSGSDASSLQDLLKQMAMQQMMGNGGGNSLMDALSGNTGGTSPVSAGDSTGGTSYTGTPSADQGFLKRCKGEKDPCASGENRKITNDTAIAKTQNERSVYEASTCQASCHDEKDGICRATVQFKVPGVTTREELEAKYEGKQVGNGTECVSLVQAFGAGNTGTWRKCASAMGNDELPVGTLISTFNNHNGTRYGEKADGSGGATGHDHAGIYAGRDCQCLYVLNTWNRLKGKSKISCITYNQWNGSSYEAGENYYAICH
jgi:hypothetical protein